MTRSLLGLDFGGSSIKGALVDVETGRTLTSRVSIKTPEPSTPDNCIPAIAGLVRQIGGEGPVGLAVPCVVQRGIARTAANIDHKWIGVDGAALLGATIGRPVTFLNDADAAGLAEMKFGAGRGSSGVVIVLTFGTGIGSAIYIDGHLVPNTEFGHMEIRGMEAEHRASARVRTAESLDWPAWAERVNEFLARMHALFWPDLFILSGAVTENYAHFGPLLKSSAEIRSAQFTSEAGIVGAALAAAMRR
ncbi:MAG: polyphosphate--glucose phosphotransferase [Steroidobacteraceae bacterium]